MKKIIRLTESDLTRIVKRVIEEQKTQPIVDAGYSRDMQGYAIALSQPTVAPGSGHRGVATAQVKFNGMRIKNNGEVVVKGGIVLYAGCGKEIDGVSQNPANLSPRSSADLFEGGSTYVFSKGGAIDKAVRAYCDSKGQPSSPSAGSPMNVVAGAKEAMALVK
jgi:hypothetical protein